MGINMVSLLAKIYVYTPPADLIQDIALISAILIALIIHRIHHRKRRTGSRNMER
jgi:hypothetical protein